MVLVGEDPRGVFVAVIVGCAPADVIVRKLAILVEEAYAVPTGGEVTTGAASPSPAETIG